MYQSGAGYDSSEMYPLRVDSHVKLENFFGF